MTNYRSITSKQLSTMDVGRVSRDTVGHGAWHVRQRNVVQEDLTFGLRQHVAEEVVQYLLSVPLTFIL